MISEKMKKLSAGKSAIRAMFEDGKRLAAEFGAENVYDFSLGNPSVPAPPISRKETPSSLACLAKRPAYSA